MTQLLSSTPTKTQQTAQAIIATGELHRLASRMVLGPLGALGAEEARVIESCLLSGGRIEVWAVGIDYEELAAELNLNLRSLPQPEVLG